MVATTAANAPWFPPGAPQQQNSHGRTSVPLGEANYGGGRDSAVHECEYPGVEPSGSCDSTGAMMQQPPPPQMMHQQQQYHPEMMHQHYHEGQAMHHHMQQQQNYNSRYHPHHGGFAPPPSTHGYPQQHAGAMMSHLHQQQQQYHRMPQHPLMQQQAYPPSYPAYNSNEYYLPPGEAYPPYMQHSHHHILNSSRDYRSFMTTSSEQQRKRKGQSSEDSIHRASSPRSPSPPPPPMSSSPQSAPPKMNSCQSNATISSKRRRLRTSCLPIRRTLMPQEGEGGQPLRVVSQRHNNTNMSGQALGMIVSNDEDSNTKQTIYKSEQEGGEASPRQEGEEKPTKQKGGATSIQEASLLLGLRSNTSGSNTPTSQGAGSEHDDDKGDEGTTTSLGQQEDSSKPESIVLPKNYPTRLYTDNDKLHLNALHCFIRSELLEVFVYEPPTTGGKKHNSMVGRVGFQCVHCALARKQNTDPNRTNEVTMAVFYPRSLAEMYRLVTNWTRCHLRRCKNLPESVKTKWDSLRETEKSRGKTSWWAESARQLGMVDCVNAKAGGVRFREGLYVEETTKDTKETTASEEEEETNEMGKAASATTDAVVEEERGNNDMIAEKEETVFDNNNCNTEEATTNNEEENANFADLNNEKMIEKEI